MAGTALVCVFCCIIQLVVSQESCVTRSVYYVSNRTGADSEDCLRPNQRDHPCASLSYLKDNIHQCATMKIVDHLSLNNTVIFFNSSWTNISLTGSNSSEQSVTIYCKGNSGIHLKSTAGFILKNLHFSGCSFNTSSSGIYKDIDLQPTSVMIEKSENVRISECSFCSSCGSGLLLIDIINTFSIANSMFNSSQEINEKCMTRKGGIVIRMLSSSANSSIDIFLSNFISNRNSNTTSSRDCTGDSVLGSCHTHNDCGGAIDIVRIGENLHYNLTVTIQSCFFNHNYARAGGAVNILIDIHTFIFIIDSHFIDNQALCQGGAVQLELTSHIYDTNVTVVPSSLPQILSMKGCQFIGNKAKSGGALAAAMICNICYKIIVNISDTYWSGNSASKSGLAIDFKGQSVYNEKGFYEYYLKGEFSNSKFENNVPVSNSYGVVSTINSAFYCPSSELQFTNNSGTALVMKDSSGLIRCETLFQGNSGTLGGAIYMEGESDIEFAAKVEFLDNSASVYGGAVYSKVMLQCTFNIEFETLLPVYFANNSARGMDQSIYIESIGLCGTRNERIIEAYHYQSQSESEVLLPLYTINVSVNASSEDLMLGEVFYLKPYNLKDYLGRSSVGIGHLRFFSSNSSSSKDLHIKGPMTITLDHSTGRIKYYFFGSELDKSKEVGVDIYFERYSPFSAGKVELTFRIVPCKFGYKYSSSKNVCECMDLSSDYVRCAMDEICIKRHYWYSNKTKSTYPCPIHNCVYTYQHCPNNQSCPNYEDFCILQSSDELCLPGRTDVLCSECAPGNSFTFAAVKCTSSDSCNPWNIVLLIFALLVICILFIFGLLLSLSFKISVGSGFMYGVVYFFSVATIYTRSSELYSHHWLQVLMSVDTAITLFNPELLGYIDICFIESWRNPLSHEVFRLSTPIFIISIICLLVWLSRCNQVPKRFSLAENSPVHAICLLILLSYTSISFSSLRLLIPMKVNGRRVVQMAPTVPYFSKKHAPFAVVAIIAELFFSLPLCILFLFAPLISRKVNLVRWRLKAIVDEFQACYRPQYRWFAGFYFMARQVIYLTNGILTESFPNYNNILTMLHILILLIHASIQPYSKKWLNILDTILLTDIVVLSMMPPVKLDISDSINSFFYSTLMPYALIIIPTVLLFGVIAVVSLKKLLNIICGVRCFANGLRLSTPAMSTNPNAEDLTQ